MTTANITPKCVHCEKVTEHPVMHQGEVYCCNGCVRVREMMNIDHCPLPDPNLQKELGKTASKYAHLNTETYTQKFIKETTDGDVHVTFFLPDMFCASCVQFLEQLHLKHAGVVQSEVNFPRKELRVRFDPGQINLGTLATLLAATGYPPELRSGEKDKKKREFGLIARIGVAGFCFGNIMLMSFPEYLGAANLDDGFRSAFGWLNLLLSLPVLLFSGWSYLRSAATALRNRTVNIDVPVSIGILALFIRSTWEVVTGTGIGFFDSLAGLVFFLLIGKWYQARTFGALSYDRDYKSYFPIAVTRRDSRGNQFIPIADLKRGDEIIIHHQEIIPADCTLLSGDARIDYSFVTGEADPQKVLAGEDIQAGGRQTGAAIVAVVRHPVEQSRLTRLWNSEAFLKEGLKSIEDPVNRISKHFTWIVLSIAIASFIYWFPIDERTAWNAFTATLIVACPCALALTLPFTLGSVMRLMGKSGLYLKNTSVIEKMSQLKKLIFDKTGTLTRANDYQLTWHGRKLSDMEFSVIASLAEQSAHPLSRSISQSHPSGGKEVNDFIEVPGKGVSGRIDGQFIEMGSATWLGVEASLKEGTQVHVTLNHLYVGYFTFDKPLRQGLQKELNELKANYELHLLSGDNSNESARFKEYFRSENMHFNQSPEDKMEAVSRLQTEGVVAMVGDGLNDAGALKMADFGVAVVDDLYAFSPACDAILHADALWKLNSFFDYARDAMRTVRRSFVISFLYNAVGIGFAVQGLLTPLVAAILMPLSSVNVVLFTVLSAYHYAGKNGLSTD